MIDLKWSNRHITDSAQRILRQIPSRCGDRGLHVVDSASIVMMTLWSLLLWESKVGRIALEQTGVDRYDLARDLDRLLDEKADENPVAVDRHGALVLVKTGEPYRHWDFDALLEPLLQQAEHEARALGHKYVGSEHLVLAIIRIADPTLTKVLQKHSISHKKVQDAVKELLQ